jgi:hypothetical protein
MVLSNNHRAMTVIQRNILRLLYDPQIDPPNGTCTLEDGLESSAERLVAKGLLWKKEVRARRVLPTYGLTPKGIAAAKIVWQAAALQEAALKAE